MQERNKIILAFATVYLVWGSTYLANEYAIDHLPPFFMAGIRFSIAGALVLLYSRLTSWKPVTLKQFLNCALSGFLFIFMGMGMGVFGQQYVDSGVTALIIGTQPMVVVLLVWILFGERPSLRSTIGVVLGLVGMYLLVNQSDVIGFEGSIGGIAIILSGVLAWVIGSIITPKMDTPSSSMVRTGFQMVSGGVLLFVVSGIRGDYKLVDFATLPSVTWIAWSYLIVFGSIIAFSAYNYILTKVSTENASTHTYVNPIIAVFLGWLFRNEPISAQTIVAGVLMLVGVYFIISRKQI